MKKPYNFKHAFGKPLTSIEGPWIVEGPGIKREISDRTKAAAFTSALNIAYKLGYEQGYEDATTKANEKD